MYATHKQPDHLMLSFYCGPAQQQQPAFDFNPQQQGVFVSYFDIALYGATENMFFVLVCYFFRSSQDYVLAFVY